MDSTAPLNDKKIKLFCIPILGVFIPNITSLITNRNYSIEGLLVSYCHFIMISFIVWEGNVRLMYFVKRKFASNNNGYYKIILSLFFANIVYSGIAAGTLIYIWKIYSNETGPRFEHITDTSLVIIIAATFIANIYELVFLNHEREFNLSRVEQLNIAKAQAELEALKSQIDPHFIFNSLNTLSYLIIKDPPSARLFNETLAKVYRYILGNRDKDLVLLKEEIEFIHNYFYLLRIRFNNAVNMEIEMNDMAAEDFLIPPISLQALVENAIKHNDFSEKRPLKINVFISSNYIIVKNKVQIKSPPVHGSRIGLANLNNRYKLITNKNLVVENNIDFFSVRLPVLKL
ncbi:MAG TPA: histidine kinase [Puia sp.]|nr:histidine kinase [Puia sp.]